MSLYETLRKYGYTFRQHLEEEGWGTRKLTVVDLDDEQRAALQKDGVEGLRNVLEAQGKWPFPALDIQAPLPRRADLVLGRNGRPAASVVASESTRSIAQAFIDTVADRFGFQLPLVEDVRAGLDMLQSQHVVLFGGAHENRFAMDMALRYQTCFLDATVPGEDGWAVAVLAGMDASGYTVAQIAASPSNCETALACLAECLEGDRNRVILRHVHRIQPGAEMRRHFPPWEDFAADLVGRDRQNLSEDLSVLADRIAEGLDSGGPEVNRYNAAPVDTAVQCARYYQLSGDARALRLFRELLFRLADYYLKTPEGASYIADLDFRIGSLVLFYSRLECESVFSDDDRLFLANLLLSCVRSCHEYVLKMWPVEPDGPTRHNHETFPARSLMFGADYFARYDIPYIDGWRAYADTVFSGGIWNRIKQRENAHHYEQTAYEHAAAYSAFTGHRLDLFGENCLHRAAMRQIIATDNFLRPVDYGDTGVRMQNGDTDILALLAAGDREDATLKWYASESFARQHHYLSSPIHGIPGLRTPSGGAAPPARCWERMPLEPRFIETYDAGFPQDFAFDKLAFRTGWTDDDHYLLFEGVGNQTVSHSHNELNSIVRLNHLGRHWIISNGYGRRAGMTNVSRSFSTRIRGPEDHNMLVLTRRGDLVRDLPVCNALLQETQAGDLACATGVLLNYGGVDWFRTLLILADRFVLILDRVHVVHPELEAAHIEWNGLGRVESCEAGYRLAQQNVFMHLLSASDWASEQDFADQSADWKRILESGAYPYASFPLVKLVFHMPGVEANRAFCLVTLLAASRSPDPAYGLRHPEPGRIRVEPLQNDLPDLVLNDRDLSVRADASSLEVRFAEIPDLPDALRARSASAI